jgi:choline dehydrogenase-like flavoprotein
VSGRFEVIGRGSVQNRTPDVVDVCIVGGGTVGLVVAADLQRRGFSVLVLESGETLDYQPVATADNHLGVREGWASGLGGTSRRWGGQLWEWEPADFRPMGEVGSPGPWPMPPPEITAYYEQAYDILRLGPTHRPGGPRRWRKDGIAGTRTRYSTWLPWTRRNFANTVGAQLLRTSTLRLQTDVVEVNDASASNDLDSGGAVTIVGENGLGLTETYRARYVVLAAGTLGNVRLLTLNPELCPEGSPLGKGFMDHLSGRYATFDLTDRRRFEELLGSRYRGRTLVSTRYVVDGDDGAECAERSLAFAHFEVELGDRTPIRRLRTALRAWQARRSASRSAELGRAIAAAVPEVPRALWVMAVRRRRPVPDGAVVHLRVDVEQAALDTRYVTFDEGNRSRTPKLVVNWFVSDEEREAFDRLGDDVVRRLGAADYGLVLRERYAETSGLADTFHMMGGTRMGASPDDGVVDSDCRVRGSRAVYVAGASVFPSGGVANPTFTAIALALRLTDHLSGLLRNDRSTQDHHVTEESPP